MLFEPREEAPRRVREDDPEHPLAAGGMAEE